MMTIPIAAVANQSLVVQLDLQIYSIALHDCGACMAVSIARNEVSLVSGQRLTAGGPLLPYRHQELGNFVLLTDAEDLPDWQKFGVTQFFAYLTPGELAALRI